MEAVRTRSAEPTPAVAYGPPSARTQTWVTRSAPGSRKKRSTAPQDAFATAATGLSGEVLQQAMGVFAAALTDEHAQLYAKALESDTPLVQESSEPPHVRAVFIVEQEAHIALVPPVYGAYAFAPVATVHHARGHGYGGTDNAPGERQHKVDTQAVDGSASQKCVIDILAGVRTLGDDLILIIACRNGAAADVVADAASFLTAGLAAAAADGRIGTILGLVHGASPSIEHKILKMSPDGRTAIGIGGFGASEACVAAIQQCNHDNIGIGLVPRSYVAPAASLAAYLTSMAAPTVRSALLVHCAKVDGDTMLDVLHVAVLAALVFVADDPEDAATAPEVPIVLNRRLTGAKLERAAVRRYGKAVHVINEAAGRHMYS